jgi:deferrochelatase/peroxidase EfeB
VAAEALDLPDIQGNLMRGYNFAHARHFAVEVRDPRLARSFIGELAGVAQPPAAAGPAAAEAPPVAAERSPPPTEATPLRVSTEEEWDPGRPDYRLNLGFTWPGLKALGIPAATLEAFPVAFREGPAARAAAGDPDYPRTGINLGDDGESGPDHWVLGGHGSEVHMMLSLYTDDVDRARLEQLSQQLRTRFGTGGIGEIVPSHDADALPEGRVHFGYRDGIAQPRIRGAPGRERPDMQPEALPGDFLLGRDYVNAYGGNHLGSLPPALGDNATYAAFRILRQDVVAFEHLLEDWGRRYGLSPELVAAKLLGRWRDGTPLTLSPDSDSPVADERLNEFDYAAVEDHTTFFDDPDGVRCPIGAHIRRLNPRGSLVMGQPHSRRLVRRSMPYGPQYRPGDPEDEIERGLIGMFVCGDLEMQYEFILRVWANEDISTHGLRGTRDPLLGAQPTAGGMFVMRTDDARDPIVMTGLPRLIQTRGSVYCMLPGIGGLRYIASTPPGERPAP